MHRVTVSGHGFGLHAQRLIQPQHKPRTKAPRKGRTRLAHEIGNA
jgi:hypothetical protein